MNDNALIIRPPAAVEVPRRVEVCRSFSYKLNVAYFGGHQYESRDFFCSEKTECTLEDAPEVSAALYQFCKSQVLLAVKDYIADMQRQREKPRT